VILVLVIITEVKSRINNDIININSNINGNNKNIVNITSSESNISNNCGLVTHLVSGKIKFEN